MVNEEQAQVNSVWKWLMVFIIQRSRYIRFTPLCRQFAMNANQMMVDCPPIYPFWSIMLSFSLGSSRGLSLLIGCSVDSSILPAPIQTVLSTGMLRAKEKPPKNTTPPQRREGAGFTSLEKMVALTGFCHSPEVTGISTLTKVDTRGEERWGHSLKWWTQPDQGLCSTQPDQC